MTTLGQKQRKFARLVPRLIDYVHEQGYECTLGDAFRDERVHGAFGVKLGYGHAKSGHKRRLALDLNLFKDGEYLEGTEFRGEKAWAGGAGTLEQLAAVLDWVRNGCGAPHPVFPDGEEKNFTLLIVTKSRKAFYLSDSFFFHDIGRVP